MKLDCLDVCRPSAKKCSEVQLFVVDVERERTGESEEGARNQANRRKENRNNNRPQRMKAAEKVALLAITEHIEMELLSREDPRLVMLMQEEEQEHSFYQETHKPQEHPLAPDREEEPEPRVQTRPRRQPKPKAEAAAAQASGPHTLQLEEPIEIEMEILPPFKVTESELVELKSDDPSVMIPPNKTRRLRWKRLPPQNTGLVVKDVICLPRGHHRAHLDRPAVPKGQEREALSAARITIDSGWSAEQMCSRLVMLFQGRFVQQAGQRFSFTYLQCVQGSRVLFVPDMPAEGWTGQQVLRLCGHGPLYIFSHLEQAQRSEKETPAVNKRELRLEANTHVSRTTEEPPVDLETILRLFRQENAGGDGETRLVVRRWDVLRDALKTVRRPSFCFRRTPAVVFSGEETDGREGPVRELFRLALLELQHSCVFEGRPGRLLFTHDLTALEKGRYYEAGVLIGWSLTHGGPGPRCLHPALYQLMCGRESSSLEDFCCTDIVDPDVQTRLQQLLGCTDGKQLSPSLCNWVSSSGIPGFSSAWSYEIPAIYERVVKHHIYHRVASMVSQFKDGLNSCGGLWDTMQSNETQFVALMTGTQQQPLTLEGFAQLFTVCYSRSACQRAAEEATVAHWETVLALISGGQAGFSFEDLITFITGADRPPPLGFPTLISLRFYSQDASVSSVRLPHASTCALELFLPREVAGAAHLLRLLSRSVREALGFTRFQNEERGHSS